MWSYYDLARLGGPVCSNRDCDNDADMEFVDPVEEAKANSERYDLKAGDEVFVGETALRVVEREAEVDFMVQYPEEAGITFPNPNDTREMLTIKWDVNGPYVDVPMRW
jgi:hypothetical protein